MRSTKGMGFLWAALVLLVLGTLGPAQGASSPKADVQDKVDEVLGLVKDKSLDKTERRKRIADTLREAFDFEAMSKLTLATNWKKATPEQQARFQDLFEQVLNWTYISRIDDYSDETVEYGEERISEKGRAEVETFIVTSSGTKIPITYKMREVAGDWLAYDVVIEGVSLVRTYRTNYRELVKKEGFDGLFKTMEAKVAELEQSVDAPGSV